MSTAELLPLTDRAAGATLFHLPGRSVDTAGFLADARALARTLPARPYVINLCADRYWFTVGLAAALLSRQVSLLCGDPPEGVLRWLAEAYPDAYLLADGEEDPLPGRLARHKIRTEPAGGDGGAVAELEATQPAIIALTSGTTGRPVGTRKCWGELVARSRAAAMRFGLAEGAPTTIIGTVPPSHMYGLETTVLLPLSAGVSVWCGPSFFPANIIAAIDRLAGPRILVTTPLHLRALIEAPLPQRPPERVISATAPLERALADAAERRWSCEVLEIFGATEVGSIASRRTVAETEWALYPGVTLAGPDAAPLAWGPWAEPRRLADVVELNPDGRHFRLTGRAGDLVKRGGRRASLAGLSGILTNIPGVEDGAFLTPTDLESAPNARLVAVAVAPSHSVSSLTEALRTLIDAAFMPRPLVLVDRLPRDALGKLPREALLATLREAAPH
ncbi:MAG: AMP-binding protein [Acetobacteraceae bacterium]